MSTKEKKMVATNKGKITGFPVYFERIQRTYALLYMPKLSQIHFN
jgi:hypothetical protein